MNRSFDNEVPVCDQMAFSHAITPEIVRSEWGLVNEKPPFGHEIGADRS
jgi:hypothetical protein